MFAQVNSEHCRHKIFNASWTLDKQDQPHSLFNMIRNTEKVAGEEKSGTISAYSDNAAVFEGSRAPRMGVREGVYGAEEEQCEILIKVLTILLPPTNIHSIRCRSRHITTPQPYRPMRALPRVQAVRSATRAPLDAAQNPRLVLLASLSATYAFLASSALGSSTSVSLFIFIRMYQSLS